MQTRIFYYGAIATFLLVTGCGGGGGGSPGGNNPPPGSPPDPAGPANKPPVAIIAGPAGAITELSPVALSAANSSDPEGDNLTFAWRQVAGSTVALSGSDGANVSFTAPKIVEHELLAFELTVTDSEGASAVKSITVAVMEAPGLLFAGAVHEASVSSNRLYRLHATDAAPVPLHDDFVQETDSTFFADLETLKISPDRRRFAVEYRFEIGIGNVSDALFVGNIEGGPMRLVAGFAPGENMDGEEADIYDFDWSSDGKRLVFVLDTVDSDAARVFVLPVDADDTISARLDMTGHIPAGSEYRGARRATFSPDGKWLAFAGELHDGDPTRDGMFIVPADSENSIADRQLVSETTAPGNFLTNSASNPAFSPDGRYLAFVLRVPVPGNSSNEKLMVADMEAENVAASLRDVTGAISNTQGTEITEFKWSVDNWLAFRADLSVNNVHNVYAINADPGEAGSQQREQFGNAGVSGFAWSHEGHRLAYIMTDNVFGNRLLITNSGNNAIDAQFTTELIRSPGLSAFDIAWSPDDAVIAIAGDPDDTGARVFMASTDTDVPLVLEETNPFPSALNADFDIQRLHWMIDGESLLLMADPRASRISELFEMFPATGETALVHPKTEVADDHQEAALNGVAPFGPPRGDDD